MVVGICQLDMRIPENHSLKGKRHVLRKLIDRVRSRFNVAISEVGDNDLWQRAQIGICAVGNDRRHVNSCLDKIIDFIEKMNLVEVVHLEMEILTVSQPQSFFLEEGKLIEGWSEKG
jgi:uncharacterized protein YlxP (DUF503 family)